MFAASIITAIVLWAGYAFLLWDLAATNEGIEDLAAEAAFHERRYADIQEAAELLGTVEDKTEGLNAYLLARSDQDIVAFIETLESVGADTGVTLDIESPSIQERTDAQEQIEAAFLVADLTVEGAWGSVMRAVALIETLPYSISITEFTITQRNEAWAASVEIEVLLQE